jgi:hypothetical protein
MIFSDLASAKLKLLLTSSGHIQISRDFYLWAPLPLLILHLLLPMTKATHPTGTLLAPPAAPLPWPGALALDVTPNPDPAAVPDTELFSILSRVASSPRTAAVVKSLASFSSATYKSVERHITLNKGDGERIERNEGLEEEGKNI